MSTKKLSYLYLQKDAVVKIIALLETRLEMVKNKIKKTKIKNLIKRYLCWKILRMKYKKDSI